MAKPPTKNDVIKKYLYNDLERFLKRIYRYNHYELIFSRTLNEYDEEEPGIKKQILNMLKGEYPGTVVNVINVHRVMVDYYDFVIDIEDIKLCIRIEDVLSSAIEEYTKARYRNRVSRLQLTPHIIKDKKLAIKEMMARGFISINDFEGYNPMYAHITSNANSMYKGMKLYYPKNFTWDNITMNRNLNRGDRWYKFDDVYKIIGSLGVRGFTRVSTPMNR